METYPISMVPGPVSVPLRVREAYARDYGSADMEEEFLDLYRAARRKMQLLLGTQNEVVFHTGEGMIALWGALKSVIVPGDRVLAISTGVFGSGIGDMAAAIGAEVKKVDFAFNQTINDLDRVESAVKTFNPKMITVVHCETPSGTLNPIDGVGFIKNKYATPLLYMDCVASFGGVPVESDRWQVDFALGGSQKVLSAPPSMSMLSVSDSAWGLMKKINYRGYDALLPLRGADRQPGLFPYTPHWHGMAAVDEAAAMILEEGLETCFARHACLADYTRKHLAESGVELFCAADAVPSPTVTAAKVPEGWTWAGWNKALRQKGLVVGGSYGPMAEKVFRLGHMGCQAKKEPVYKALEIISDTLLKR